MQFTFHSTRSDGRHGYLSIEAKDLIEATARANEFAATPLVTVGYTFVAWSPEWPTHERSVEGLRSLALKTGNQVERVNGKFVAYVGSAVSAVLDPSVTRDVNHKPIEAPERTPFDPFKDFVVGSVDNGDARTTSGRQFGNFTSPDEKPTENLVDPSYAMAAERSR